MKTRMRSTALVLVATLIVLGGCFAPPPTVERSSTLPSWNAGGSRDAIIALHARIADATEGRDGPEIIVALEELERYTRQLAQSVFDARSARTNPA